MRKLTKKVVEVSEQVKPMYSNLHEVMDYTKPLSIFFSGVEYESYLDILYELGIRNFLMSYEYLRGKGSKLLHKYKDIRLFIDSGAYTYQNDPKYESFTLEQWENQIKTYLAWAEKHKEQIFAIADLDLQYLSNVGYDKVYEWRREYFEPFMLKTGIPVCFIYHEDGIDYWEKMCQRYPYVGLSLAIDKIDNGDSQLKEMFRIAEKYNTLCQGMASTNTKLLANYPFYTVDSTTWNVGLKYGEISVWTGNKMSRFKKEEFVSKAFNYIKQYDKTFDLDLILNEDKTEMIKVNAYAFIQAEKYVNERLKSKMYWFKAKTNKNDLSSLDSDFFPSPDLLLNGDDTSLIQYASKMNINPECAESACLVHDITVLMNWENPDYNDLKEEYIDNDYKLVKEIHDLYINRIVGDNETRVKDLVEFFKECISGDNDKLLQLGTNFDRVVKERDNYIEDEVETELVELSPEEIKVKLAGIIPDKTDDEGMPEVLELDKEIFAKTDIIPTFDEKGKFVKGQVAVRKPKKLYSKKYPKVACDTCYAAQKCPEYKSGHVCAFHKMFERFDTRNMSDIISAMQGMVEFNLGRMQRAMIIENMTGTFDPNVTGFINQNMSLLKQMGDLYKNASPEVLRQTKVVYANGTEEHTTEITNPQSNGLLARIFGGGSDKEDIEKPIEAKSEIIE